MQVVLYWGVKMKGNYVLALDIGTRKVTGLILEIKGEEIAIKAMETLEHETRSMLDGQIHDIPKVAGIVARVHASLENQCGCRLTAAAVAAAGRSLFTMRGESSMTIKSSTRLRQDDILRLEYAAVQRAQQQLLAGPKGKVCFSEQYHCVGYSVIRYILDESQIGNLLGQRGNSAGCEVIATFLPRVVVDSLRSVLELAGLKLQSMTLEPIAALRMAVPEGMRKLNLALVDIGAGTSDIAITRNGTVFAYDMVPVAGDEVTEAICQNYLLDFMSAENVKRKITKQKKISFTNILGEKITLTREEIHHTLTPILEDIAEKIAGTILKHNQYAPQAVFCVGGGSLITGLTEAIAVVLDMDASRVTIKGREMIALLPGKPKLYHGPELVTPLGIAYTSVYREALHFYHVSVNGQKIDVMDLGHGNVADALLAVGVSSRELVGAPGKGLSVEVNDQILTFPGEMGSMAEILVNSQPASLETKISAGDKIDYTPAKEGTDARVSVAMLLSRYSPFRITLEGRGYALKPPVYRGEQKLDEATELADRDRLRVLKTMSLSWVLAQLGLGHEPGSIIRVSVNDNKKQIPYGPRVYLVNGTAAVPETDVTDGDAIDVRHDGNYPTIACLTEARRQEIEFSVNGRTLTLAVKEVSFEKNGRKATLDTPIEEGDSVEITETYHEATMADILNLIDFDTTPPVGQNRLILRVNGRDVQFTTAIINGDRIEVGWSS